MIFMIYKFHKNLSLGIEFVVERKNCIDFKNIFNEKVDRSIDNGYIHQTIKFRLFPSNNSLYAIIISYHVIDLFIFYFGPEHFWIKRAYYGCL